MLRLRAKAWYVDACLSSDTCRLRGRSLRGGKAIITNARAAVWHRPVTSYIYIGTPESCLGLA